MKDFTITSIFLITVYISFIFGVMHRYRSYDFMLKYKNYTNFAKLREAINEETNMISTISVIILPVTLFIDILIMILK